MLKRWVYRVNVQNIESRYERWMTFACASDDPSEALAVILKSVPLQDALRCGRPDERKRVSRFEGPNEQIFVEA